MRYKLITLPKNTVTMAILAIDSTVKEINSNSSTSIQPSTLNLFTDESYTFTIHNTDIATIQVVGSGNTTSDSQDRTMTISSAKEVAVVGQTLSESTSLRKTQLTITGQQSGQSVVITLNHNG
jgi:phage anti-repressor protein